jgi:hypothetical protein
MQTRLAAALLATTALAVGVRVGIAVGHSAKSHTVTVAGRVVTVRTRASTRTVTKPVVRTHVVTVTQTASSPAPASEAEAASTTSTDCNDLPASASTNLAEVRESRCEIEKLNAENPSAVNEHEIETMISDERAIEASE